jgi:hypothetical protein
VGSAPIAGEGVGFRGSGLASSPGYPQPVDVHVHALAVAQLEAEAAAVERLTHAYAALADARREAHPVPVSPGQLRLVVGA